MTYQDLQNQAAELLKQAEQVKQQEHANHVETVKQYMTVHGVTLSDLGVKTGKPAKVRKAVEAKFFGPNGEMWSGRGRKPKWFVQSQQADAVAQHADVVMA